MNRKLVLLLFFMLFYSRAGIAVLQPEQVPEPLQPWVNWVLLDDKQYQCPFIYNNYAQKYCAWPARLNLNLRSKKGQFNISWQVYAETWVTLPGSKKFWPQQVTVNNRLVTVIEKNARPAIKLAAGNHTIRGQFFWDYLPNNLAIPDDTGLLSLTINNQAIAVPDFKKRSTLVKVRPEH